MNTTKINQTAMSLGLDEMHACPALFSSSPGVFVDLTGEGVGYPEDYINDLVSPTPKPFIHPPARVTSKQTRKARRAIGKVLQHDFHPVSYHWLAADGQKPGISREKLQKHYNASFNAHMGLPYDPHDFLPDLPQYRLAAAAAGGEMLYLRPRWGVGIPMYVRVDIEGHKGPPALAVQAWVDSLLGGMVNVYYCESIRGRGRSGYIGLIIPTYIHEATGEERPCITHREANRFVRNLHKAMKNLAAHAGFHDCVEIKGQFLKTSQSVDEHDMPDEPTQIGKLDGETVKIPFMISEADAKAFDAATLRMDDPQLLALIERGLGLPHLPPPPKLSPLQALIARMGPDEDGVDGATDADDDISPSSANAENEKPSRRCTAVCLALHQLKICTKDELLGRQDEVIALAMTIYAAKYWGDNVNYAERLADFASAFVKVHQRFDPAKVGPGAAPRSAPTTPPICWFEESDIRRCIHSHDRAWMHKIMATESASLVKRGLRPLTDRMLAVAELTMAKDGKVDPEGKLRKGDGPTPIPALAVQRMLKAFGFGNHPSVTAAVVRVLQAMGRVKLVDGITHKGKCCTWSITCPPLYGFIPGTAEIRKARKLEKLNRHHSKALEARRAENKTGAYFGAACAMPSAPDMQFPFIMPGYDLAGNFEDGDGMDGNGWDGPEIDDSWEVMAENEPVGAE